MRARFEGKKVVQFTATPYREDGQDIGGRLVYVFPLHLAQEQGYFAAIGYLGVRDLGNQDETIAKLALERLRSDLAAGHDHILMARVSRIGRAREVLGLYQALAEDLEPQILHSKESKGSQKKALAAVKARASRVVVCVDMLGEGFDLAALKVAAIHDLHKSLGITLQFIGRFARVTPDVGDATVVVGRPDSLQDETLRALYMEDADWNGLVRDLSETATATEEAASEFEDGFTGGRVGVAARTLAPKMSTVVYRTDCPDWTPEAIEDHVGRDRLITSPIPVNRSRGVAWFVTRNQMQSSWGPTPGFDDVIHELYVMYWDRQRGLLYVNSSNNDSEDKHHQKLAAAVAGDGATRIVGEDVFRAYGGVERLVPTNVGVLDIRNRARRFSMLAGANVDEGFPRSEASTKTKTNIFAHGYENGERVSIGASLKGRIWAWRAAGSLWDWVTWCDSLGEKLINESVSIDAIMRNFIRPQALESRPELVPLAAEWPWEVYASTTEGLTLRHHGEEWPLIDTDIRIANHTTTGPIGIRLETPDWSVDYELLIEATGMDARTSSQEVVVASSHRELSFSEFVRIKGLTLLMERDAVIEPPGVLLQPERDLGTYDRSRLLTSISWNGIDIRVESQGADRRTDSIQARVIETLKNSPDPWELIVDDDGSGEIADVVAIRRDDDRLIIRLVHCKFSARAAPGARIGDLYAVCGQAQKSILHRRDVNLMLQQLIRRERRRQLKYRRSGIELGTDETLYEIEHASRLLLPEFTVVIVQPGMSKARASTQQLELLAATETYLAEVGAARLEVFTSP